METRISANQIFTLFKWVVESTLIAYFLFSRAVARFYEIMDILNEIMKEVNEVHSELPYRFLLYQEEVCGILLR